MLYILDYLFVLHYEKIKRMCTCRILWNNMRRLMVSGKKFKCHIVINKRRYVSRDKTYMGET